jgi:membrane protein DedA with SNARE-associated domain
VCSPTPPRRRSAPGVVGSAVWNAVLIGVGYALGANLDRVSGWVGSYSDIVLVAVVATAILYPLITNLLSRKRKDQRVRERGHGTREGPD